MSAFFLTFPTGRFTPRWTWALFVLAALILLLSSLPVVPTAVSGLLVPLIIAMIGVQVYRYARIYDAVQRQQAKWLVFGFSAGIFFFALYEVLGAQVPGLGAPDSWYQLINALPWFLLWTLLLLSVSIPILRYRLWDIDALINKALVYGLLTALLAAIYAGLVLGLQALLGGLLHQTSAITIVISTLAIAALFQPLRRRLQALIDRRFYRRKYNAQQIVAAFSHTLRQEVDLEQVREQLVAVVQETMQPVHVSLWLRPSALDRKDQATWRSTPPAP